MSINARQMWIAGAIGLLAQLALAGLLYEVEYSNILSVRNYQSVEDQTHNKTTIALERCEANAVLNHSDNWDRLCMAYGLQEGCGLPQDRINGLAAQYEQDVKTCQTNHQYAVPTRVGASMDSQGNILP